ncbi:uncharacterized protein isoform X3 [Rhodnius prolixus]|uniref:uncharacterized protein isoform X3 n=1 Tax=Rhodnius prolixus TaxID=13249 RepID=UPI003D18B962
MENDYQLFEIRFNDVRVRERMIKLMNTDVVRLMDRDFMKELQNRIAEVHKEELEDRLKKRAEREFFREIDLVIQGVLPKEKALKNVTKIFAFWDPEAHKDHPPYQKKVKTPPALKPPDVDYRPYMTKEELNPPSPGTDISPVHSEIPEDDDVEKLRKDFVYNLQEEIERMYIQPYTYEKVRYETENVKQLRKAKDVEAMYEMAEKIFIEI